MLSQKVCRAHRSWEPDRKIFLKKLSCWICTVYGTQCRVSCLSTFLTPFLAPFLTLSSFVRRICQPRASRIWRLPPAMLAPQRPRPLQHSVPLSALLRMGWTVALPSHTIGSARRSAVPAPARGTGAPHLHGHGAELRDFALPRLHRERQGAHPADLRVAAVAQRDRALQRVDQPLLALRNRKARN